MSYEEAVLYDPNTEMKCGVEGLESVQQQIEYCWAADKIGKTISNKSLALGLRRFKLFELKYPSFDKLKLIFEFTSDKQNAEFRDLLIEAYKEKGLIQETATTQ